MKLKENEVCADETVNIEQQVIDKLQLTAFKNIDMKYNMSKDSPKLKECILSTVRNKKKKFEK